MKRAAGQALVETAVAVLVFATLLAAMPCVLVYHDLQRAAQRAARDASFVASWEQHQTQPSLQTMTRATLIQTGWRHPGDGLPIANAEQDTDLHAANAAPPGRAAAMLQFIAAPLRESGGYLDEGFALAQQGYRNITVDVRVPPLRGTPEPFATLTLPLRGAAALLTDAWNASGPEQVRDRAGGLVPSRLLQQAEAPVRAFTALLRVIEPAYAQFCPGLIEPDLLPESRLGILSARTLAADASAGRCR